MTEPESDPDTDDLFPDDMPDEWELEQRWREAWRETRDRRTMSLREMLPWILLGTVIGLGMIWLGIP